MYTDCVASSSRITIQDNWDPPSTPWSFPLSDCRYESIALNTHPRRTSTSTPPQQSPAKSSASAAATSRYSTVLPTRKQLSPGVFEEGKNTVYSSALPEVQQLLATARSSLALPTIASDLIFTLAALDVFYKPMDPVHWLFWSDEKKFATADVVTRISLHQPPLITSPVAWNGKQEYLYVLSISRPGWRQVFQKQPWASIVVPPKPSTPPRQLNLRKRKPQPGAFRDPSRSPELEDVDGDELVLPREAGTASRGPSPDPAEEAPAPKKRAQRSRAARAKPKPPTPSPTPSLPDSPPLPVLTLSPEQEDGILPADIDQATTETATRSKRKISPPSRYPQSVSSIQELGPILDPSLLQGPGVMPPPLAGQLIPGHSRTRSTSTDSSTKTAVASDVSRSASVASGATAVDAGDASPSKKRKSLERDDEEMEYANADFLDLADAGDEGQEDDDPTNSAMGRAKRSRKPVGNGSLDDAVSEKTKQGRAQPGNSARTSRKKARKA